MFEGDNAENIKKLIEAARYVSRYAYCVRSHFQVGAAILDSQGEIFKGVNIEFDNYSNTIHAEESAIAAMITNKGGRPAPIAVAVYTITGDFPCGMCRQSLFELGGPDLVVIAVKDNGYEAMLMKDLLPRGFRL